MWGTKRDRVQDYGQTGSRMGEAGEQGFRGKTVNLIQESAEYKWVKRGKMPGRQLSAGGLRWRGGR